VKISIVQTLGPQITATGLYSGKKIEDKNPHPLNTMRIMKGIIATAIMMKKYFLS